MPFVRVTTEGDDRVVLDEQQGVTHLTGGSRRDERPLTIPRLPVRRPTQPLDREVHVSDHSSRSSVTVRGVPGSGDELAQREADRCQRPGRGLQAVDARTQAAGEAEACLVGIAQRVRLAEQRGVARLQSGQGGPA